jgi:hypothetical protein
MLIQGSVGQPSTTSIQPGTTPTMRQGQLGDVIVSELHGRYYETAYRRNLFNAATQTGVTTTVGLVTSYSGLALTNPTTSTVNLVLNKVGYGVSASPAADMVVGLAFNTSTTAVTQNGAVTPRNNFLGGATAQGLVSTGTVTFPSAPIYSHVLGVIGTSAATGAMQSGFVDLEGAIILPPGSYVCIVTSTASAATSFFGSFQWEEVPV